MSHGLQLTPWPRPDFSQYGEIEIKPIGSIQKVVGSLLASNWARIPHVFHQDTADITELDAARIRHNQQNPGQKLTLLPYLIKALVTALREFPSFNASLDGEGNIIYKKYFNIGVAVDTPGGLLVPVIRDCDKKTRSELASEIAAISEKARSKGLSMAEMSGGCMTISSLGHIGGKGFTPIINAPEVAILGVTKAEWQPVRGADETVVWRYRLPLSLSYDHRVLNGVDAARFCVKLAELLGSPSDSD